MVMDVLSISDMAESKLPPDVIAFFSIKTCRHCWAAAQYVLGSSYVLYDSFWVGIVSWWGD